MIISVSLLFLGCSEQNENSLEQLAEQSIKTDIEELATLIKLSPRPEKVYWSSSTMGNNGSFDIGSTDWSLNAVLQYNADRYEQLVATKRIPINPFVMVSEEAFVKLLVEQKIVTPQQRGSFDASSMRPDHFTKSPLLHGHVTFSDSEHMVYLHLYTM